MFRMFSDLPAFRRDTLGFVLERGAAGDPLVRLVEDDLAEGMFGLLPHTPWAYARKKRKLRRAEDIMGLVVERTRKRAAPNSLFTTFEAMGLAGSGLQDEILMLLLAGHHTSGSAAAWILYHLAADHTLAGRIADEARRIGDQDGELTPLAIRSAPLSRAFVQEALRLYPSTYWTSRELRRDQTIGGRRLRRGTSLMLSPWQMHRDPRCWSEPARFDLTRSWTSNPAYMPFGFGRRACVGLNVAMLELQLIALEFALCFEARPASATPPGPPKPSVTLVPPAIRLRLRARLDKLETHEFAA